MTKRTFSALAILGLVFATCSSLSAGDSPLAVTAKIGTLGAGGEVAGQITPHVNARVGVNTFQYDYSGTENDVDYNIEVDLLNFTGLIDWFPFEKAGFRLTGGLIVNENSVDAQAKSAAAFTIGNTTYTAADVGSLTGDVSFNKIGPYLGIGWGNPFGKDKTWSISLDVGAFYQGSPDVDLKANGALSGNAAFEADLAREEDAIKDDVQKYTVYPVVMLGLTYRF